jgi:hypothetical protein
MAFYLTRPRAVKQRPFEGPADATRTMVEKHRRSNAGSRIAPRWRLKAGHDAEEEL